MLALYLLIQFLDRNRHSINKTDSEAPRFIIYLGGKGGTGKIQILNILKDTLQLYSKLKSIQLTAPSDIAAVKIGGRIIYSAISLI